MSLYDLITNRKPTYVYMYTFSNGKQYIGISHDPARRLKAHIDRATSFSSHAFDGVFLLSVGSQASRFFTNTTPGRMRMIGKLLR